MVHRRGPNPKTCAVCRNVEHRLISAWLLTGRSPRQIAERVRGLSRKQIEAHRLACLAEPLRQGGDAA